jgi:hypothetical protein
MRRLSRRGLLAATTAAAAFSAGPPAAATPAAAPPAAPETAARRLRTGFERLAQDGYAQLSGRRTGMVTSPTGKHCSAARMG